MNIRKIENGTKACKRCQVIKSLDQFYKDNSHKLIEPYRTYCKTCDSKAAHDWKKNNRAKLNSYRCNWYLKLRKDLLDAYGRICSCCGETHEEFLSLEHIGGGGNQHRKLRINNASIYTEIRQQGFPRDRYTLLCMNCNFATRYRKECPHKKITQQAA